MLYIVLIILTLFFHLLGCLFHKHTKYTLLLSYLFLTIFIILGGIKWNTGTDFIFYKQFFYYFTDYGKIFTTGREPGWTALNIFIRNIFEDYTVLLFVWCGAATLLQFASFKKHSDYYLTIVFLIFCFYIGNISTNRQMLAVSIVMWSSRYMINKNFLKFFIGVLIAGSIHASVLLILPFYFIFNRNISIFIKTLMLLGSIVIGFSGLADQILKVAEFVLGGISTEGAGKIDYYSNNLKSGYNDQSTALKKLILSLARRAIIFPVLFYVEYKILPKDKVFKGFSNLFIVGNCIFFIVINFAIMQRLATVFYIFEIPLLLIILSKINRKAMFIFFLTFYSLIKGYSTLSRSWASLNPYYTIFSETFEGSYWEGFSPKSKKQFK